MQITTRGLTFDVHVGGPEGGRPVILLHGFPQHSGEWDGVVPALWAAGLRTFAVDQRGYSPGARPPAVADYRIEECALDVVSIVEFLGYGHVDLVGHDWGSVAAWQTALRHPERVRTLTAISSPHPLATLDALKGEDQRQRSSYITVFRREGYAEDLLLQDDARRLRDLFNGAGLDPDTYVRPLLEPGALTGALNWYRALSRRDTEGIGDCTVPTTYIWSDRDIAIGPESAEACAGHVSADYRFVVVPGVTHWIPDQAPDVVSEAVLARIASVAPA